MSSLAGPSRSRPQDHVTSDADMLALLAQLTLADIEEIENRQKGKQRQGAPMTDAELALSLMAEDARSLGVFNSDHALARRLAQSESDFAERRLPRGPPIVSPARSVSIGSTQSTRPTPGLRRQTDVGNPSNEFIPTDQPVRNIEPTSNGGLINWVVGAIAQFVSGPQSPPQVPTVSLPGHLSRGSKHICVICRDPIKGTEIRVPCGDYYDEDCIVDLFQAAIKDETLYPPRCCQRIIPLTLAQLYLPENFGALFREKAHEFGTTRRVYCANPSCSHFLGPQHQGRFPTTLACRASGCSTRTCNKCRAKVQGATHVCRSSDDADREALAFGEASGWRRCPGCGQMVELTMGCYHMTCRCKTQFCYLCSKKWRRCTCRQWDEQRLFAAAERHVDVQLRTAGRQPIPARVAAQRTMAETRPVLQVERPRSPTSRRHEQRENVTLPPLNATLPLVLRPRPTLEIIPTQAAIVDEESVSVSRPSTPPVIVVAEDQQIMTSLRPTESTILPTQHENLVISPPSAFASPTHLTQPNREQLIREAAEKLRLDHDCQHAEWKYRSASERCASCDDDFLYSYVYSCVKCQIVACPRCRRNRF